MYEVHFLKFPQSYHFLKDWIHNCIATKNSKYAHMQLIQLNKSKYMHR